MSYENDGKEADITIAEPDRSDLAPNIIDRLLSSENASSEEVAPFGEEYANPKEEKKNRKFLGSAEQVNKNIVSLLQAHPNGRSIEGVHVGLGCTAKSKNPKIINQLNYLVSMGIVSCVKEVSSLSNKRQLKIYKIGSVPLESLKEQEALEAKKRQSWDSLRELARSPKKYSKSRSERGLSSIQEKIISELKHYPKGISAEKLSVPVGYSKAKVYVALKELEIKKWVYHLKEGKAYIWYYSELHASKTKKEKAVSVLPKTLEKVLSELQKLPNGATVRELEARLIGMTHAGIANSMIRLRNEGLARSETLKQEGKGGIMKRWFATKPAAKAAAAESISTDTSAVIKRISQTTGVDVSTIWLIKFLDKEASLIAKINNGEEIDVVAEDMVKDLQALIELKKV